jgi:hypothetical protein
MANNRKSYVVGLAKSGKKTLLNKIKDNQALPDYLRVFYQSNATTVMLSTNEPITVIDSQRLVLYIDPTIGLVSQFQQIENLLTFLTLGKKARLQYWLYISKVDQLTKMNLKEKEYTISEINKLLERFSAKIGRPKSILLSDCDDDTFKNFVQTTVAELGIEPVKEEERKEGEEEQIVASEMILDGIIQNFRASFDKIENEYYRVNRPSNSFLTIKKKQIFSLVESTLDGMRNDAPNAEAEIDLSIYQKYESLYHMIKTSKVLLIHKNPKIDDILRIKIPETQQKILGMIREEALYVYNSKLHSFVQKPDFKHDNYNILSDSVSDALRSSLFNEHRSNIPNFFRPKVTNSVKELEGLKNDYASEILKKSRAALR